VRRLSLVAAGRVSELASVSRRPDFGPDHPSRIKQNWIAPIAGESEMTLKRPVWLQWSQIKRRPAVVARLVFIDLIHTIAKTWNWVTSVGEKGWRNATISLMIIAVAAYVFAALYIFQDPMVFKIGKDEVVFGPDVRARAVTPLLLGLAGFVTLVATLWRGTISIRQTEEQKRQNDGKEEADLGLLLEKGQEHTSKREANDIALGIAMLETVAQAENDTYASYALYVIGSQLEPCFKMFGGDKDRIFSQIKGVFKRLANDKKKCMRSPNNKIKVDVGDYDQHGILVKTHISIIELFEHMPACTMTNGRLFVGSDELAILNDESNDIRLHKCLISAIAMDLFFSGGQGNAYRKVNRVTGPRYDDCVMENFIVGEIGSSNFFDNISPHTKFVSCDLTNTQFASLEVLKSCKFTDCYYYDVDAPHIVGAKLIEKIDKVVLAEHGITSRKSLLNALST
jgi:hypothetical protein